MVAFLEVAVTADGQIHVTGDPPTIDPGPLDE
jgi:hypothetical protein